MEFGQGLQLFHAEFKMQNDGVRYAHIFLFPEEIPQFCILHSAFCIDGELF